MSLFSIYTFGGFVHCYIACMHLDGLSYLPVGLAHPFVAHLPQSWLAVVAV